MRNFLSILTAFLLPLSASAFVSQVYTTNNAATVDAHVLAVVGGGVTATNAIGNNGGSGTNVTLYGTVTSTNLNAAIQSATNNALALASNSFYGIGNVSNFQTFLQVSNTIQSATNGFSGGGISAVTATNIANASALAATNAFASSELASATNAVLTVATNAANLIGVLPQYPTIQIATNTPFTNAVLLTDGTNRYWATTLTGLTITNLVAKGPLTNDGDTSHSVLLIDGSGNPVFRGLTSTAWADSVSAQFFQVGPNSANIVFQSKTGLAAARFMLNAIATQFASCSYVGVPAPLSGSLVEFINSQTNRVVIIQTNGTILSAGAVIATNGIASYATNSTLTSTSTAISNSQPVNMTVLLTAATGLSYTNGSGVLQWSGITVAALTPFTIQPKGQLVGTAITCVGTNAW